MELEIYSYSELMPQSTLDTRKKFQTALLKSGIVGVRDVPKYTELTHTYINAARVFSQLPEVIKNKYQPNRDAGEYEGYEIGAEWFKDKNGEWKIDANKASYYAIIPDCDMNIWPAEMDLRTPILELGDLIFQTGKKLLSLLGIDEQVGVSDEITLGHARMLHYRKVSEDDNSNEWCGIHYDQGLFTGLVPAFYFHDNIEIVEPENTGLHVILENSDVKRIRATDHSIMLFQVGEFGQILLNDNIRATNHFVRKAPIGVERYTMAVFFNLVDDYQTQSQSILTKDDRYQKAKLTNGSITYGDWSKLSYKRYRALMAI